MNCHEATTRVAAHADGELDGVQRRAVEKHLAACPSCAEAHQRILALRARLQSEVTYHKAPEALRARIAEQARPARRAREPRWRWLSLGALAGCAATVLAFFVTTAMVEHRAVDDLAVEAVGAHVRATLSQHVIEVASSDQHTVKPWLSARLDYSPPVPRLDASGFVLTGGRLDYLDKQRVAVLVYRYRDHVIDVFVRPATARPPAMPLRTLRGFNIAHARGADMDWLAVSDVSADVLVPFVEALAAAR
ncbi:MAG TPA: zf-HC2 domain-containing protein [Casimicrobiaceae bacterium]|jgi:anti-sigma factor RsiW|nr:zf-HC2 domain-containing protein [Casimicrobiaceae bacterium]